MGLRIDSKALDIQVPSRWTQITVITGRIELLEQGMETRALTLS
jgi:hypothetical protein